MTIAKQKLAVKKTIESNGILRGKDLEGIYSRFSREHPGEVMKGKAFQELFDQELPDHFVVKGHKKLFEKRDILLAKGVEMAYKVKGHYAPEKHQNTVVLLTSEQVKERLKNLE